MQFLRVGAHPAHLWNSNGAVMSNLHARRGPPCGAHAASGAVMITFMQGGVLRVGRTPRQSVAINAP
jgi:hypothetical protein